jgi:hypothetical protein
MRLNGGWRLASAGAACFARFSQSRSKLLTPYARIFPWRRSASSAPIASPMAVVLSGQWIW